MEKNHIKKIIKKVICGLTGATLLTVGVYKYFVGNDYLNNYKYQAVVSQELQADMQIMKLYNSATNIENLIRLKPNDSNEIYVNIDDAISPQTRTNIIKTLSEFNKIFSKINDSYNFVVCKNSEYNMLRKNNTTISFGYSKLDDRVFGVTKGYYSNYISNRQTKNCYIFEANILLNIDCFDNLSEDSQIYVLKHEILHALGFADLYTNYDDETSIMNMGIVGLSNHLSPNDLKMLYVAYGNKHINADKSFNQAEMDKIKKMIDNYEIKYYEYLMNTIKNEIGNYFEKISLTDLSSLNFTKDGAHIKVENNQFEYVLNDYNKKGKVIVGEDYVILPDIQMENRGHPYNDFLVLLKQDGKINCYNIDIFHSTEKQQIDELVFNLDIKIR